MTAGVCELMEWSHELIAMSRAGYRSGTTEPRARYLAAYTLGNALSSAFRLDEALGCKREALRHARATGDPAPEVAVLNALGCVQHDLGDCEAARATWHEGLAVARAHDVGYFGSHCLLNLGGCEIEGGHAAAGIDHVREALEAYQKLDAGFLQALAWSNLADGYALSGGRDQMIECADEAVRLFGEAGEIPPHAESLVKIARAYRAAGRTERARPLLEQVVHAVRDPANPWLAEAKRLLDTAGPDARPAGAL